MGQHKAFLIMFIHSLRNGFALLVCCTVKSNCGSQERVLIRAGLGLMSSQIDRSSTCCSDGCTRTELLLMKLFPFHQIL